MDHYILLVFKPKKNRVREWKKNMCSEYTFSIYTMYTLVSRVCPVKIDDSKFEVKKKNSIFRKYSDNV